MKKALFVTYHNLSDAFTGGTQCSFRNFRMVSNFYETDIYFVDNSRWNKLLSFFRLFFPPITIKDKRKITSLIKNNEYECIFFDSSLFGIIVKSIRKNGQKNIISFFHNVEFDYVSVRFGKNIIKFPYLLSAYFNEKKTLENSTISVTLSSRDENRIFRLYKTKPDTIIPITFDDLYASSFPDNSKKDEINYLLFVGSLNRSNLDAAIWFVENVMLYLKELKLIIVGKNFEKAKHNFERSNVIVIGTTDQLDMYYSNAIAVVCPIQHGAGMKVKVAEALMFGKTIFGSQEAFEGYITENENATITCNTAAEYIEKINVFVSNKGEKFNTESRELYDNYYSFNRAISNFNDILNSNRQFK